MIIKMNNTKLYINEINQYYKNLNDEDLYYIYCYGESLKSKSSFQLELLSHNYSNYNRKTLLELIFNSDYLIYMDKNIEKSIAHEDLHILNNLLSQTYPEISYLNYLKMIKLIKYDSYKIQKNEINFMHISLIEYNSALNNILYKNC